MANCLSQALSLASPLGSSGMLFHLSESSKYWLPSEHSSRTARVRANPRATCTTQRAACRATSRQSKVFVLSSYSTYMTHSIGSRRTKTKSVAVRLRSIMAVLPCLASSVLLPSPKHLALFHHSRVSFLNTRVTTWPLLVVTSASFSYPRKSPRVHSHRHSVLQAGRRWRLLQRPILIFLGSRLDSGIHWVVWTWTFGTLAMRQRSDTYVTRRLSMAEWQWLDSLVTSRSQHHW